MLPRRSYILPAVCSLGLHSALFFGAFRPIAVPIPSPLLGGEAQLPQPPPFVDPPVAPQSDLVSDSTPPMRGSFRPESDDVPSIIRPGAFVVDIAPPSPRPPTVTTRITPPGTPDGIDGGTAAGGPRPLDARFLDSQPQPRAQVQPAYPMSAKAQGLTGRVDVEFIVDTEGTVSSVRILQSTNPIFDDATLHAVQKWRFSPGLLNGHPVSFRMRVPVVFNLND